MRSVPLAYRRASSSSASHCAGVQHAAGQARADHEAVRGLELLAAPLLAQVAVVLLVAAVELDQHRVVLADAPVSGSAQAVGQRAAQQRLVALDALDGESCRPFSRHPAGSDARRRAGAGTLRPPSRSNPPWFGHDFDQRRMHVGRHALRIAAHVQCAPPSSQAYSSRTRLAQPILHVGRGVPSREKADVDAVQQALARGVLPLDLVQELAGEVTRAEARASCGRWRPAPRAPAGSRDTAPRRCPDRS